MDSLIPSHPEEITRKELLHYDREEGMEREDDDAEDLETLEVEEYSRTIVTKQGHMITRIL